jgi:hypothetical protein
VTELGDLAAPIDCYKATYTVNGRTTTVWHTCSDKNCPKKG